MDDETINETSTEEKSLSASEALQAHLESKRKNCVAKMQRLMETEVPEKILQLDRLIDSGHFDVATSDSSVHDGIPVPDASATTEKSSGKVYTILFPKGEVTCNQELDQFAGKIKRHLMDQARIFLDVSNQLTLIVPKMQSGNTFGLMILGSFFMHLVKFINESQIDLSLVMKYNRDRSNLIGNISQYPHCEDARKALENYDDEYATKFQMYAQHLRMRYCIVTDLYLKNKDKLQEPVPENPMDLF